MIENTNNLDDAEKALRDAYKAISSEVPSILSRVTKSPPTVVHIMPKGRRVESGWFKMARWADKNEAVVDALALDDEVPESLRENPSLDEVFIAGEALAGSARDVVNLLFHQYVHQTANLESDSTYHGNKFMQTAQAMGVDDVGRHSTQGWVEFDYGTVLDQVLNKISLGLDKRAFDLYRHPEAERKGSGKMRLWHCTGCRKPAKVYTGAVIHARCTGCGEKYVYAHKDKDDYDVRERIYRAGEDVLDYAPWS